MEPDRQSIERTDFPRVADGFDPEAVAEHLAAVADAVERLREGATGSGADRVRRVVAAAEAAAAELEESAREDADRTRAEAAEELTRTRTAVSGLADRAGALEAQLDELARAATQALSELTDVARAGAAGVGAPAPAKAKPVPSAAAKPAPKTEAKPAPKTGGPNTRTRREPGHGTGGRER